jgi:hypothetical protein
MTGCETKEQTGLEYAQGPSSFPDNATNVERSTVAILGRPPKQRNYKSYEDGTAS